jgi:hypothetical protein
VRNPKRPVLLTPTHVPPPAMSLGAKKPLGHHSGCVAGLEQPPHAVKRMLFPARGDTLAQRNFLISLTYFKLI